jgi:hypothetical protein
MLKYKTIMTTPEYPQSNFRDSKAEIVLRNSEMAGVASWYRESLKTFGEEVEESAPLTDGKQWKKELTTDGEINKVDGAFFTLEGQTITRYNLDGTVATRWTQPKLSQKEGEVNIPSSEGQEKVKISGFVGIIKDNNDNILLTLGQEAFALTPKKVLAKTPTQTSAVKLQGIIEGKRELDPGLYDLIKTISPDKNPDEIFRMGILDVFPLPYADANRIGATNIGFTMCIKDDLLIEKLKNNGKNRWCTLTETKALAKAGLLNGLTASGVLASL